MRNKNSILPAEIALQSAIKFNGGGHINHSIFWTNWLQNAKGGGAPPEGALAKAIDHDFGSFDKFVELISAKQWPIQGSGWAWLGYNKATGHLEIATCDNQDPLVTKNLCRSWASTCGNMRIIFSTKMYVLIMSRRSGRSSTGKTWPKDTRRLVVNKFLGVRSSSKILFIDGKFYNKIALNI